MRTGDTGTEQEQEAVELDSGADAGFDIDSYEPEEGESATETARKISDLLSKAGSNGQEGEEGEESETQSDLEGESQGDTAELTPEAKSVAEQRARDESGKFAKSEKAQGQVSKRTDPDLEPPAGLKPEFKKAFANLPEGLKRETNRMFKDSQAFLTRKSQEMSDAIKRADGALNTARAYIAQNNMLDEHGRPYEESRLVTELISAHHNIITDPDRYLAQMIQSTGANVENIGAYLRGEQPSGVNLNSDPQFKSVLSELNHVKELLANQQSAQANERVAPMASEFEAVMREVDHASGEFRFPELHDEEFLESTKPIVKALRRTDPSLSWGDALRRAHATLTGRTYSPATPKTVAPARSNNLERARSAAVSVRGRVTPAGTGPQNLEDMDAKDLPQSATETARMIYRQLQGQ